MLSGIYILSTGGDTSKALDSDGGETAIQTHKYTHTYKLHKSHSNMLHKCS